MKKNVVVLFDRYSATGRPRPDPKTVCRGKCEGMGCYPDNRDHNAPFIRCERCGGTGLEPTPVLAVPPKK